MRSDNAVSCREARSEDAVSMEQLARTAHEDTRFFKDRMFDRAKAAELYATWIRRDMREHKVFAAVQTDEPEQALGYLSTSTSDGKQGRIGLIAVRPETRGRGLGRFLVDQAMVWFESRGVEHVKVATQGTNVAALRLYESCGFKVAEVRLWFHRWFNA